MMELDNLCPSGSRKGTISSKQSLLDEKQNYTPQSDVTFDSILNKIGIGKYHWKAWLMLGFLDCADGSETMVLSFVIPIFNQIFQPTYDLETVLGTMVYLGFMIGSFFSGIFTDRFGRKKPIIYSGLLLIVVCFWSAFPPGIGAFIFLRSIYGIINGFFTPIPSVYLAEITPAKHRGKFITLIWVFYTIGELIACIIAMITLDNLTSGNWHALLAWTTLPGFFAWITTNNYLDESPRYQMVSGQYNEAIDTLNKMYKQNHNTERDIITDDIKLELINNFKKSEATSEVTKKNFDWKNTYRIILSPKYLKITMITWTNWIINSFCYYGVIYILPSALQALNESKNSEEYSPVSILFSVLAEFPVSILAVIIVDVEGLGRKNSIAYSSLIGGLSCFFAYVGYFPGSLFWISLSKLFLNLAFTLNYQITSEIYPTKVRGTGMGMASSVGRLGAILMPITCSVLSKHGPLLPFMMFGLLTTISGICTFYLPFDTTGMEMDQIDLEH